MENNNDYKMLEKAIIDWINTFPNLSKKPESLEDLFDGYILLEIMHKVDSNHFDIQKVSPDSGKTFTLRLNNFNYLYEAIENYYITVLSKPFDKAYVDTSLLASGNNLIHLQNLIEYILGVIVQCEQREIYIPMIMTLDENSQTELMFLIEKILFKCDMKNISLELMNNSFDNRPIISEKQNSSFIGRSENKINRLLQKLDEIDNENQVLTKKYDEIADERDKLKLKVADLNLEITKKSEEIKHLYAYKEQIIRQFSSQEINQDFQNEIKFKDKKIMELTKYVEEIRSNSETQVMNLKDELDHYKKKVSYLSKIEVTLDFYKQKYEHCTKLSERITELEALNDIQQSKIQDYEKQLEAINAKVKKYVDQYTTEKDKNINIELSLTKKDVELETLKNEKKRLDSIVAELESKVHEQHRQIEQFKHDLVDTARIHQSTERAMALIANQNTQDFLIDDISSFNVKNKQGSTSRLAEYETEKELLRKDNELLSEKCKQLQMDNELLKLKTQHETSKLVEKLTKENESLKEELNKLRTVSLIHETKAKEKEKALSIAEKKKLLDEIENLRQKLEATKSQPPSTYINSPKGISLEEFRKLEEINESLREENKNLRKTISEQLNEINDTKSEMEDQKQAFHELDYQKEEELRILSSAFHELAMKNFYLEKKIADYIASNQKVRPLNQSQAFHDLLLRNSFKK